MEVRAEKNQVYYTSCQFSLFFLKIQLENCAVLYLLFTFLHSERIKIFVKLAHFQMFAKPH